MSISERALEEDEAKLDNLLHKILSANEQIELLVKQIRSKADDGEALERASMVLILTETIANLATLADEIDQHDEDITKELETDISTELQDAISNIKKASSLVTPDRRE